MLDGQSTKSSKPKNLCDLCVTCPVFLRGSFLQMNKLLIATNNQGKIKELHELLDSMGIELITPAQIDLDLDVVEDGLTYAENAIRKAIAFAQASELVSLADDSGLEVDILNG